MGEFMVNAGVADAVVDGAVRDVRALSAMGLPVHARAVTPAGPFKDGPGAIGVPVAVGGVVVAGPVTCSSVTPTASSSSHATA
ncbi:hypothetical protein ACTWPT_55675 [Nonomuraea sp. 3N208]|uniref:RraA family protein n=1 Tax=Nonomuraea sp. 3N208 TaxID=3457421 RepID=UPI003FD4C37E